MEGNITFHSGVYKLCVGQLEDITLQDNQEHVHQYTFYLMIVAIIMRNAHVEINV